VFSRTVGFLFLIVKGWKVVMVSQAASQTRFRATKHESGIAGCATIIVRVIACFQPLQDCQVCKRLLDAYSRIAFERMDTQLVNIVVILLYSHYRLRQSLAPFGSS
jgi:hypothetical protein